MAALSFELILDCLQSLASLPWDMMTSYKGLHFGDIRFALPWHTLNNCFQPEAVKPDLYSSSTAILIVFLSDEEHKYIQHMHIGLVVHHTGCNLYMQDRILPFVKSIKVDLAMARDRHVHNKDPAGVPSYALLVANYRGVMAVPTNPPYCLVYPTMYNDAEDQNHFNTAASPSGMCTCVCMCHSLLQVMDKDPDN